MFGCRDASWKRSRIRLISWKSLVPFVERLRLKPAGRSRMVVGSMLGYSRTVVMVTPAEATLLGLLPASSPPAAQTDGVVSERRALLL